MNININAEAQPKQSTTDQMVLVMLDTVSINGSVTDAELALAGFTDQQIADYAANAALIARRRYTRQLEVA